MNEETCSNCGRFTLSRIPLKYPRGMCVIHDSDDLPNQFNFKFINDSCSDWISISEFDKKYLNND